MLANVVLWFQSKTRLITEYLLLGLLVSVCGLAYSLYLTRAEVRDDLTTAQEKIGNLETSLTVQQMANSLNTDAISALQQFRELDAQTTNSLLTLLQTMNKERTAQDQRLKNLEKDNAEVRPYLNSSVPTGYDCLLEPETCPSAATSGSAKGPVPIAKPSAAE